MRRQLQRLLASFYRWPIHIWVIGFTSLLIIGYAAAVLIFVWQIPEIGVATSFQSAVSRVDGSFLHESSKSLERSLTGGRVVSLAGEKIESWPQWSRAVQELDQLDYPIVLGDAQPDSRFRDLDGNRWVKLEVAQGEQIIPAWCAVRRIPASQLLPSVLWIVLEMGLFAVGAVIFWKRPHDIGARLFYLQLVVAIGAYMGGYHWARICTHPILTSMYIVCAVLLPAVNLHFFLAFPVPKRFFRRRPLTTLAAIYGVPIGFLATILSGYTAVRWLAQSGAAPEQVTLSLNWLRNVIFGYFAVAIIWYVASIAGLIHSYVNAKETIERDQLRWILIGSLLALLPFGYALYLANWRSGELSGGAAMWPMFAASVCFTLAFAIGITRYRLLQFDQLLGSSLAYVFVSFLAGLIYCAMVVIAMLLFGGEGPSLQQAAWVSGSVLVLTIGLDFARARLRNYLDRRFRKDKTQLEQILQKFGEAVEQLVDTPTMARRLLQMTTELYGYPQGAIYLHSNNGYELAAALGIGAAPPVIPGDSALVAAIREKITAERLALPPVDPVRRDLARTRGDVAVALSHENRLMGILILGRAPGQAPRPTDNKRLAAFAPMAALALAGAEVRQAVATLNGELQSKVEKISEQQRRIFSLQQQLIAQSRRLPAEPATANGQDKKAQEPPAIASIVGSSPALQQVLELVPRIAANNSAVLIRGESGTGKELIAKALHDLSARARGPFVKVHCAALAPGVLESELFGHVKGAFTGALRDKPGRFEAAHDGTLFLDEIGDISPDVQTKLLRVLQEKTLERVGSNETIRVDVRLVTATHQDLDRLIRNGKFRADLYYRLNVITLNMPPLRDRAEDVLELAHHFLRIQAARCDKTIEAIDDDALLALRDYPWPGNVRELENTIERAVVIAQGRVISLHDLPPEIQTGKPRPTAAADANPMAYAGRPNNAVSLARQARHSRERAEIMRALDETGWNRTEAARRLGLARSTLLSRMKKFGLLDEPTDA
jgi:transcriptional regulator with GAF, ATPase, and Fis domain